MLAGADAGGTDAKYPTSVVACRVRQSPFGKEEM